MLPSQKASIIALCSNVMSWFDVSLGTSPFLFVFCLQVMLDDDNKL
jgi:hypothetical protein